MGFSVLPLVLVMVLASCDAVDRMRGGGDQQAASAGSLALALQIPGMLRAGEEGTVRLSLTNRGDSIPRSLRLDLIVPGWMELAPPRPGDREVTMAASDDGTRFSYRMDEPPLEPGATQILEQRVRVPGASAAAAGGGPENRLIRARLVNAQGQTITEVQAEVSLDSVFLAASRTAAEAEAEAAQEAVAAGSQEGAPGEARDELGPIRLGMSVGELRQAATGVRDTTWSQEGMTERGVVVPVQGGEAVALLSGDSVLRIHVSEPGPRTREDTGVGSTMEELRGHFGRACAAAGEGMVVVWFPAAPGISYALDVPFSSVQQVRRDPSQIPGTARVTRWWLRRGTDDCPAAGG